MAKKRLEVPEETRSRLLLWCDRHCCFCGKKCTTNIEIHHIDQSSKSNAADNLVPLCFDCHGEFEKYNPAHPRGSKYRHLEIKARREQIYEEYTRKYIRQINIRMGTSFHHIVDVGNTPKQRTWPDFSFTVQTLSSDIPLQIRIAIAPFRNGKAVHTDLGDLYSGRQLWNINPAQIIYGHFLLPIKKMTTKELRIEMHWKIVDITQREHQMLPFSYVLSDVNSDFWYDPRIVYSKS